MPIDLEGLTLETFELAKAQTSGINAGTGLFGYDLTGWISLIPVLSPFRNGLAREKSTDGNSFAIWRALLNVNSSQPNAATAYDYAGQLVQMDEQDMQSPYAVLALANRVTQDSVDVALGLGADPRAIARINTLNQLMIAEDRLLIGGQRFAAQTPVLAALATASVPGTGTIPTATAVYVKVAARTGENYYYGGSTVASASVNITTGGSGSNTVTATIASGRKGSVAFDWFVGPSSGTQYYYTTTVTPTLTITAIPTAAQAIPSTLPLLSKTAPTTPPTADTSADPNAPNGLIASILGDYNAAGQYVTPGTGTSWTAAYTDMKGASFTLSGSSITEIDTLLLNIWNNVYLSPTRLLMNAIDAQDISNLVLSTPSAVTYMGIDNGAASDRRDVTIGGFAGRYINKAAGGVPVRIDVMPHMPPGTVVAVSDTVPFPGSNIDSVLKVRTLRDYASFDYAANLVAGTAGGGPREDFEIRCFEAFINKAPSVHGVISGIQSTSAPAGV